MFNDRTKCWLLKMNLYTDGRNKKQTSVFIKVPPIKATTTTTKKYITLDDHTLVKGNI